VFAGNSVSACGEPNGKFVNDVQETQRKVSRCGGRFCGEKFAGLVGHETIRESSTRIDTDNRGDKSLQSIESAPLFDLADAQHRALVR
jgi:hypothetical protein